MITILWRIAYIKFALDYYIIALSKIINNVTIIEKWAESTQQEIYSQKKLSKKV